MKKEMMFKALLAAAVIAGSVFGIRSEAMAADANVTVSMKIPETVEISSPIYVMYSGGETDIFAELSPENNYEQVVSTAEGKYTLYQVLSTEESEYDFLAPLNITVGNGSNSISVYIQNGTDIINADETGGDIPDDLAINGPQVERQLEAENNDAQASLESQQAVAGDQQEMLNKMAEELGQTNEDAKMAEDGERQTKITQITGTDDESSSKGKLAVPIVVGAVIIGIGILITLAILIRKLQKGKNDK